MFRLMVFMRGAVQQQQQPHPDGGSGGLGGIIRTVWPTPVLALHLVYVLIGN